MDVDFKFLSVDPANACYGYLFFYLKYQRFSPWLGFGLIFVFGLVVSFLTLFTPISPKLEVSGGVFWGMPFYLSVLRFLIYFLGLVPLSFVLFTTVRTSKNRDVKAKNFILLLFFVFILLVVTVDFIVEPLLKTEALPSEQAILFLIVVYMFLYFYLMETVVSKSEKRFRRLVQ